MELAIGVVLGGLISWGLSHYYYRRQIKEQVNPIPYIQEVNHAIVELYGLAIERSDDELKKNVRSLIEAMESYLDRMADDLTVAVLALDWIVRYNKPESQQRLLSVLQERSLNFIIARDCLFTVKDGYQMLRENARGLLKR
jgi:hypothetical protein